MFDTQAHDFAFDEDETRVLTSAGWGGIRWELGSGGASQATGLARPFVIQKKGWPLRYLSPTERISSSYDWLRETQVSAGANGFSLRMIFADSMAKDKTARGLFLNEELAPRSPGETARWFVLLSPHGWGMWRDLQVAARSARDTGEGVFEWPIDETGWLNRVSAGRIGQRLKSLLESDSDVVFARAFASQSDAERQTRLWNWKHGNWEELQRVLRLALLSQEALWQHVTGVGWSVELGRKQNDGWHGGRLHSPLGGSLPDSLPGLKDALSRVLGFFSPRQNQGLELNHLCLKRLASIRQSVITIEANNPTAHERLEAMLAWREWCAETG